MPELEDERRRSINHRLAIRHRIVDSFKDRSYTSQACYLCNWYSNGRTLDEAIAANRQHIAQTHAAEQAEMDATCLTMAELQESFHDHTCDLRVCSCRCGCTDGPFCVLVFGLLCSVCVVREGRGDAEHGPKA